MNIRLRLALATGLIVLVTLLSFEASFYAELVVSESHPAVLQMVADRGVRALILGAAAASTGALLAAWVVGARIMRPLTTIVQAANRLARRADFSQRLPEDTFDPESAQLTRTFNGLIERVDTLLSAQRQFLADTSHELRTPLTTVRGNLELLEHDMPPEERQEILRETRDEVDRMARLVRDLLLLAQNGETLPLERLPTRLDLLVLESVSRVVGGAPRVQTQTEPVTVLVDPDRVQQVVTNLVENALRYASQADGAVLVRVTRQPPYALLQVEDDGPGVPPEAQERIFDRFYRVDRSRSRAQGGVGLGLAIVRHLVAAHGGTVRVENRPTGGACFTVTLPAEPSWNDLRDGERLATVGAAARVA